MIYMDNAATTKPRKEVVKKMLPFLCENYGNPSGAYEIARDNKAAVEAARHEIAKVIRAEDNEIYFTSGGSEADNWAIKAVAESYVGKGKHIITTAIEHHAVLHTCEYLEHKGFEVTYLPVDEYGIVSVDTLKNAVRDDTILFSVMFANNEVGSIQPIEEIGKFAKERGILFHTDAVQAFCHVPIDVEKMNIDLLSLSGHKFYGPKGIGALYVKTGTKIKSFIHGGAQERGKRAGTENVAAIVGIGEAARLAASKMTEESEKLSHLRDKLIDGILKEIPFSRLNGHPAKRLPGNVNVSFDFVEGESILLLLDMKGICASGGSACNSGSHKPSHVLLAIGLPFEKARSSLRLTLGSFNTEEEVDEVLRELTFIITRLREMSF